MDINNNGFKGEYIYPLNPQKGGNNDDRFKKIKGITLEHSAGSRI